MSISDNIIQKEVCKEILNNIKSCLQLCSNNKQKFNFNEHKYLNKSITFLECENIYKFKESLDVVKINMLIKTPSIDINNNYYVEYNVSNKLVVIDKE